MQHILKIFCNRNQQQQLSQEIEVLEHYQGFALAKVAEEKIDHLSRRFPVEDITNQFLLPAGQRYLNTDVKRVSEAGSSLDHPDYGQSQEVDSGAHHYLLQFIGPIKASWLEEVAEVGAKLQAPHANFSYIIKADERTLSAINQFSFVRWLGHLSHQDRIDPLVFESIDKDIDDIKNELPRTRLLPGIFTVTFFDEESFEQAVDSITEIGFEILKQDISARLMIIRVIRDRVTKEQIEKLSAVHGVSNIRHRSVKRTANDVASRIMNTASATDFSALNLDGSGEIVAVCDTGLDSGDANSVHLDFAGRVSDILSYPIDDYYSQFVKNPNGNDGGSDTQSGHGTHVAGSVLGDGTESISVSSIDTPIRGLAYKAQLVFQAIEQKMEWKNTSFNDRYGTHLLSGIPSDLSELFTDAYQRGARIHTNSWGGGRPGEYDEQCEQLDRFVWQNKDFTVLFAAGNDGTDSDGNGVINPMSVTSPGTAKNCICVGASENERPEFNSETYGGWWPSDYPVAPLRNDPMANNPDHIVAFSSRGPTQDQRIRPDIVAPGTFILSTRSTRLAENNNAWRRFPPSKKYFYMGGTSMATPLAAGAAALVRQFLRREKQMDNPSAALIKATLIAGATRLADSSPTNRVADNHQGFGRLNLDSSIVPTSPESVTFLDIRDGLSTGELWSHTINVSSADIPLQIVMAYSDYPGARLVNNLNLMVTDPDGNRFIGNQTAGLLSMDANNNVEKILIPTPTLGQWTIDVVASNVPQPNQDFALVIKAVTAEPEKTSSIVQVENSPNMAIPDANRIGAADTIIVQETGKIKNITVNLDIKHTYIGDLIVNLISPNNEEITLHNRQGGSQNDLLRTYDMQTTPELTSLKGLQVTGNWQLHVADRARRDIGVVRNWSMEIALQGQEYIDLESAPGLHIPDNEPQGVEDVINVDTQGVLKAVELSYNISHTYIGDLIVSLGAPSGKTLVLHNQSGGSKDNLVVELSNATSPNLDNFVGESVAGNWKLTISDHAGRDVGKLNEWRLKIHLA